MSLTAIVMASLIFSSPANLAMLTVPIVHVLDYSTTTLKAYAVQVAETHGLDVKRFTNTIECESHWKHDAVGDKGTSLGIAQFRFPERDWGFASSTALDPYQAIEKMAEAWLDDKEGRWSCFHLTAP